LLLPPGIVGPRVGGLVSFRSFYVNGPPYGGLVGDIQDAARYTGGARGGPDPLAAVMARAAAPALAVSGPGRR
jgi:hypothetical protein